MTEPGPGWTIETLRLSLEQRLTDLRAQLDERYSTQVKAVEDALKAQQAAAEAARRGDAEALRVALAAQEKALDKALTALEKRLDLLNELRSGVATVEQLEALEKQLDDFKDQQAKEIANLKDLMNTGLSDLRSDRDQARGQTKGISTTWAVLIAVVTLAFGGVGAIGVGVAIYYAVQGAR